MTHRRVRLDHCLLATTLALGFISAGVEAAPTQTTPATPVAPDAASVHLEVEKSLRKIIQSKAEVSRGIDSADFTSLRRQMAELSEQLRAWRRTADRTLLLGAWRSPERKQAAASVIGRAERAEILALMSTAIVTGYEYPAGKVPSSFIDATTRLFGELEELSRQVASLNREVG